MFQRKQDILVMWGPRGEKEHGIAKETVFYPFRHIVCESRVMCDGSRKECRGLISNMDRVGRTLI